MFRRRRESNVYDIHAARRATSGIGAYDGPNWVEHEYPKPPSVSSAADGRGGLSPQPPAESPPHSIAEAPQHIDELRLHCEQLERSLTRVRSELSQAVAQRDMARRQRDDAKAEAAQYKGMRP